MERISELVDIMKDKEGYATVWVATCQAGYPSAEDTRVAQDTMRCGITVLRGIQAVRLVMLLVFRFVG
jgi:hypothetical protein